MLAKSAFEIQKKSPGRFLVKQLLKLQATKTSSIQVMQNVVCHVGESFEQNLVEIMVPFFLTCLLCCSRMLFSMLAAILLMRRLCSCIDFAIPGRMQLFISVVASLSALLPLAGTPHR